MEILTFMAANPWLSFFCLLVLSGVLLQLVSILKDVYINTIWCIRGEKPTKSVNVCDMEALSEAAEKATSSKKEDDENKLKDCR
jgi:hypothetical protein